ncbi:invasin domain 3-containing protein [Nocardioides mangrovi]|uniref:M15 family metallopeptidase n=1 Tax=Nocardioides mangrovi TaxID=2874580 RepID=A0ABS7U9G0_9ACTN|nr:M15 family metallopeptidase [Nocardioides mangrovi]MBZ5737462.1 M15 family metallopeptidase [Nocardioides mangrovi]
MSSTSRVVLFVALLALTLGLGSPAGAAEPAPTTLAVGATRAYAGAHSTVTVTLTDAGGQPVAGAEVRLERPADGVDQVQVVTTGDDGTAATELTADRDPDLNHVSASYAGDETHAAASDETTMPLAKRSSTLRLTGPHRVVDEQKVTLVVRWRAGNDDPVAGPVRLFRKVPQGWRLARTVRTGGDGTARVTLRPRTDTRWQARAADLPWVRGDRSAVHRIDNRPPGTPVRLPKAAPRPRRSLPAQSHAVGTGAHLVVSRIPARIWRQMTGISWHRGCPVGRSQLRLVRVNYWDYSGYRRRGELVANADAARAMGGALAEMYRRDLPIRAMYRVDRFGWGARSRGGDDYASMAAGNTSAFNCRDVTGRPGTRSPHSWGRSLDVNTWENPYRSAQGTVPNTWWQSHSHPRVAWRSSTHAVVEVMARHGLRWTYGLGDTQHFDYVGSYARAAVAPDRCRRYCD